MTIRLLTTYSIYPANAIVTLDGNTEAGLVALGTATSDLTGGVPYVQPFDNSIGDPQDYGSMRYAQRPLINVRPGSTVFFTDRTPGWYVWENGASDWTVFSANAVGNVWLSPPESGDASALLDAADLALGAQGGGIVLKAGQWNLSKRPPLLRRGVVWYGEGDEPQGEVGVVASSGTRLVATTPGAYRCWDDGLVDLAVQGSGPPNGVIGCGVVGMTMIGFQRAVNTGALYAFGAFMSRFERLTAVNCTDWSFWFENFFHCKIDQLRSNASPVGQFAFVSSSNYNTGNSVIGAINSNAPAVRKARGVVFMCRGAGVVTSGSLNDLIAQKLVSVMATQTTQTINGTPAGGGSSVISVSAADAAALYVNAPVTVAATVNGLTGSRYYFVSSINTTTNQITLSNNPDGGFPESVALTFAATTVVPLQFDGAPNLEILGSPKAEIQPSTFKGLNLENGNAPRVLIYRASEIIVEADLVIGSRVAEWVLRNATPIVTTVKQGGRRDFDSLCRDMIWIGRLQSWSSTGAQGALSGKGMFRINAAAGSINPAIPNFAGGMAFSLQGTIPEIFSPNFGSGVGIAGVLSLYHNQFATGASLRGGCCATITTSGGSYTLPASSDTAAPWNLGEAIYVFNPFALVSATITATGGLRIKGDGAEVTSYSLMGNVGKRFVLQKDGTGLYWAVY